MQRGKGRSEEPVIVYDSDDEREMQASLGKSVR